MKPFATLSMWSNVVECRSCRIQVYDGGCSVEMRTARQVVFTQQCANLTEAFEQAELLRLAYHVEPSRAVAPTRQAMTQRAA